MYLIVWCYFIAIFDVFCYCFYVNIWDVQYLTKYVYRANLFINRLFKLLNL